MNFSKKAIENLKEQYEYAIPFLETFVPLEELCLTLAEELPAINSESIKRENPDEALCIPSDNIDIYLDAIFF